MAEPKGKWVTVHGHPVFISEGKHGTVAAMPSDTYRVHYRDNAGNMVTRSADSPEAARSIADALRAQGRKAVAIEKRDNSARARQRREAVERANRENVGRITNDPGPKWWVIDEHGKALAGPYENREQAGGALRQVRRRMPTNDKGKVRLKHARPGEV